MKLEIEKKDLMDLISKTQKIVEVRNTMPVLVNILLSTGKNALTVFATDLEVSLTDQVSANIKKEGQVAVGAKVFFDVIRELNEGKIHLTKKENNWLEIKQNKSVSNIVGISVKEYPKLPTHSAEKFVKMSAAIICEMIEKTIYSVSSDETRYHLNGVYFEQYSKNNKTFYRMVATDGHRLSMIDRTSNEEININSGVIIPRKGLSEIKKLLDAVDGEFEIAVEGSQVVIRYKTTLLMIRLIEGKYPNYEQLLPKKLSSVINLQKNNLLTSLKRVSLLSNQKSKGVTFTFNSGKMEITSNNPDLGDSKEEVEINYEGNELKIGFNAKYILEVLSSINEENIKLELKDQLSPGLIRPETDSNYTCVVMPMRI